MSIRTENKRGTDCTGSSGETSRVLTLANTMVTQENGFMVHVNGLQLIDTTEYSVTHNNSASTITFVNRVWDADYITIIYIQTGGTPISSNYCTTTDVYNRSGLTSTQVSEVLMEELILDAEAELESLTQNKYTDGNSITEYFSIKREDVLENKQSKIMLTHWPIQSIAEFKILDEDGDPISTFNTLSSAEISGGDYDTDDYWLEVMPNPIDNNTVPWGQICLKSDTISEGTNNVKISYTYGYETVPRIITALASYLSGIRAWIYFLGGNYDDTNSYSLSELSVQKGDFFGRGQQQISMMQTQIDSILDRVGRQPRVMFYASGSSR